MSTIKVTNLQDTSGANSSTSEEIFQGRAKAWVTFDGSFGSSPFTEANGGILNSFNVSSITDESTGHFVINFANSLANSNYAIVATATNYTNDDTIAPVGVDASTAYTNSDTGTVDLKSTTQVRIGCAGGSTAYDAYNIYAVVFGD